MSITHSDTNTGAIITDLWKEYSSRYKGDQLFGEKVSVVKASGNIECSSFCGALRMTSLISSLSIQLQSPALLAAPIVLLLAQKKINIGIKGQHFLPHPVRFYAPEQFIISAPGLSVGNVQMLSEPKEACISCKNLDLTKEQEEDPYYFEIVKSWLVDDTTEVTIRQAVL
jgi:hypothetical protein